MNIHTSDKECSQTKLKPISLQRERQRQGKGQRQRQIHKCRNTVLMCMCVCLCARAQTLARCIQEENPRQSEPWKIDLSLSRHRAANYHGPTSPDLNHSPKCQHGGQGVTLRCCSLQLHSARCVLRAVGSHSHFSPSLFIALATKEQGGNSRPSKQKGCFMFFLTSEEFSHCSSHQNLSPTLIRHSLSAVTGSHIIFPSLKHVLSSIFNSSSCFNLF